ncbi:GGDEF domain-containing protein [Mesorhizobium xinjiangense]|uniref:GGDEF domain-containing protein n=1 Tax=Mesorhizobium xinjiangense TaxID=2678685 RepID=UPI0012EDD217|nr:GGDEF domain-containing protein [Mesorhizobium xinjiangense]
MPGYKGLARIDWPFVLRWTMLGLAWCFVTTLALNEFFLRGAGSASFADRITQSALFPLVVAGPVLLFLALRLHELSVANRRLGVVAATDSLTACLNRGAFSEQVGLRLSHANGDRRRVKGALLVIDADHFKSINDMYGHDQGDEALRVIASAIRGSVRQGDLVGRLGGEEFGVFLPGASGDNATGIAERIRKSIATAAFRPQGKEHRLTVSVGGVSFEDQLSFVELFRIADKRLYCAKNAGRNRIEFVHLDAQRGGGQTAALH